MARIAAGADMLAAHCKNPAAKSAAPLAGLHVKTGQGEPAHLD